MSVAAAQGQPATDVATPSSDHTVAVLPFSNLSGAETDQWIGRGIAETLAADLGQAPGLTVLPPEALGQGLNVDERAVLRRARELGVTRLVGGGYQRVGDRLRVTGQLIEVESGTVVHTFKIDGTVGDLFGLQDQVVDALGTQFGMAPVARSGPAPAADAEQPPGAVEAEAETGLSGFVVSADAIDGPPPPLPPETIARDEAGRATIRAVRVVESVALDGALDEQIYQDTSAISDFIQAEPDEGDPATEKTEVWMLFDDDNVYISGRCWDSAPESQWVINEMRRDSFNILQNERFGFLLDTFYDRRNGILFNINAIGGRMDGQVTDERDYNGDWNPIWEFATGRFDGGWTFEVAIPFKSLRYRPGGPQIWGVNFNRRVFWKNEGSYVVPIPAAREPGGIFLVSLAATVVGIEVPDTNRTLEIKPYAITDLTTDRTSVPELDNDLGGDVGLDVKYGITENLVGDLTINTDFAQVEADEQQVNLTRFSLFFPEKREFFLENQGLFGFGGAGTGPFSGGRDTPILFYSRRIGLQDGREVPMQIGGRLTGRVGAFTLGVLNVQTDDEPVSGAMATNFSVVRVKRDLFRKSSIGAIFTGRSVSTEGSGSGQSYGLDGTFAFYDNLNINTYWAKTQASNLRNDDESYRAQLDYRGDRYGVELEHLVVGDNFNPEVGFLRRDDFERSFGSFRFSPRPYSIAAIRKFTWEGRFDYFEDRVGVVETRLAQGMFGIEFENSDEFDVEYTNSYEFLKEPFEIDPDVTIPVAGYRFQDVLTSFRFGRQRRLSGNLSFQHGGFYGGEKTTVEFGLGGGFRGARLELTQQLSIEPGISLNWVDLPEGNFTTELVTARTTYTVTPWMFVSALVQYNSSNDSLGTNVRFRWEYQPGSELFVVYNEQRDTLTPRFPELENRAFIIKINRLFRF